MNKCFGCNKPLTLKFVCDDCVNEIFEGIFWESIIDYLNAEISFEEILDVEYRIICRKINKAFSEGKIKNRFIGGVDIKDGESLIKLMRVGR